MTGTLGEPPGFRGWLGAARCLRAGWRTLGGEGVARLRLSGAACAAARWAVLEVCRGSVGMGGEVKAAERLTRARTRAGAVERASSAEMG